MDKTNEANLRSRIEDVIRGKFPKYGSPDEAHMHNYNIFFSIYRELYREFMSIKKNNPKYKQIDFIQSKGKLEDYYEIVQGNQQLVRERYHKEQREKADRYFEQYAQEQRKERLERERREYEEKVKNGTNTPLDDLIAELQEKDS
ncbi:hypothetical protein KM924_22330 [Brevibacillus parabrevis]|uniref:hypothetical protein n=1 Tax=Brevibacillus parabrevis TaxID=54914 RepID=UPI001C22DA5D|nr:hypothetical protein [Brevibacillus parabrevis]MBU8715246.1 hypothetical protein [Brevibacillus parabrevis]